MTAYRRAYRIIPLRWQMKMLPYPYVRIEGGHRVYGWIETCAMTIPRRAQEPGFTLDEIRELLRLVEGDKCSCAQVKTLVLEHVRELGRKISDLKKLKWVLDIMAAQCTGSKVPECPVIDALFDTRTRPSFQNQRS